jgi:rare lipoprotein A
MIAVLSLIMLLTASLPADAHNCSASWYGKESGSVTASGAHFNPGGHSIALRSHKFGDRYRVTYRGRSAIAVHNDFGPAKWTGRGCDLSHGLARAIGFLGLGIVNIERVW